MKQEEEEEQQQQSPDSSSSSSSSSLSSSPSKTTNTTTRSLSQQYQVTTQLLAPVLDLSSHDHSSEIELKHKQNDNRDEGEGGCERTVRSRRESVFAISSPNEFYNNKRASLISPSKSARASISGQHHSYIYNQSNETNNNNNNRVNSQIKLQRPSLVSGVQFWARRSSPEWKPRRASVASCQLQYDQDVIRLESLQTNYPLSSKHLGFCPLVIDKFNREPRRSSTEPRQNPVKARLKQGQSASSSPTYKDSKMGIIFDPGHVRTNKREKEEEEEDDELKYSKPTTTSTQSKLLETSGNKRSENKAIGYERGYIRGSFSSSSEASDVCAGTGLSPTVSEIATSNSNGNDGEITMVDKSTLLLKLQQQYLEAHCLKTISSDEKYSELDNHIIMSKAMNQYYNNAAAIAAAAAAAASLEVSLRDNCLASECDAIGDNVGVCCDSGQKIKAKTKRRNRNRNNKNNNKTELRNIDNDDDDDNVDVDVGIDDISVGIESKAGNDDDDDDDGYVVVVENESSDQRYRSEKEQNETLEFERREQGDGEEAEIDENKEKNINTKVTGLEPSSTTNEPVESFTLEQLMDRPLTVKDNENLDVTNIGSNQDCEASIIEQKAGNSKIDSGECIRVDMKIKERIDFSNRNIDRSNKGLGFIGKQESSGKSSIRKENDKERELPTEKRKLFILSRMPRLLRATEQISTTGKKITPFTKVTGTKESDQGSEIELKSSLKKNQAEAERSREEEESSVRIEDERNYNYLKNDDDEDESCQLVEKSKDKVKYDSSLRLRKEKSNSSISSSCNFDSRLRNTLSGVSSSENKSNYPLEDSKIERITRATTENVATTTIKSTIKWDHSVENSSCNKGLNETSKQEGKISSDDRGIHHCYAGINGSSSDSNLCPSPACSRRRRIRRKKTKTTLSLVDGSLVKVASGIAGASHSGCGSNCSCSFSRRRRSRMKSSGSEGKGSSASLSGVDGSKLIDPLMFSLDVADKHERPQTPVLSSQKKLTDEQTLDNIDISSLDSAQEPRSSDFGQGQLELKGSTIERVPLQRFSADNENQCNLYVDFNVSDTNVGERYSNKLIVRSEENHPNKTTIQAEQEYQALMRQDKYSQQINNEISSSKESKMGPQGSPDVEPVPESDYCDLESLIVESWLDDHPNFVHDYFIRKASCQLIDSWLLAHAKVNNTMMNSQTDLKSSHIPVMESTNILSEGRFIAKSGVTTSKRNITGFRLLHNNEELDTLRLSEVQDNLEAPGIRSKRSKSQSMSCTSAQPARRISASNFESCTGSGYLRPIVCTTPDGRPTFLSSSPTTGQLGVDSSEVYVPHKANEEVTIELDPGSEWQDESSSIHLCSQKRADDDGHLDDSDAHLDEENPNKSFDRLESCNDDGNDDNATNHDSDNQSETTDIPHSKEEAKLVFELVKNICNELDIKTLLHKILRNISVLINADKSSLFLVCGEPGDPKRHLVSQLFNVDQDSDIERARGKESISTDIESKNEDDNDNDNDNDDDESIRIPWGTGLVGYVAESGEFLNIANCYEDARFTNAVDKKTGYVTKHMLCAPIYDKRNHIVGVAQVINKRDGKPFNKSDEAKFKRYLQFCGIGLCNAQSYELSQIENRRNQVLLDLAQMVFEEQSTIEQVVYRIMLHTQSLIECQRCQVLLIDDGSEDLDQLFQLPTPQLTTTSESEDQYYVQERPRWRPQCSNSSKRLDDESCFSKDLEEEHQSSCPSLVAHQSSSKLFSLVFDFECDANDIVMHSSGNVSLSSNNNNNNNNINIINNNNEDSDESSVSHAQRDDSSKSKLESKKEYEQSSSFPINIGITGYVAMTGETLNIEDAHKDSRFDRSVDEHSNFRHKSILCMPIRNGQRKIIGVSQLINKKNGRPFNKNDENLFEAFAIFCGLGIHNTLMYEKVVKIMAKQRVTFEVLSYHATAPLEEAKKLYQEQIPSCYALNLSSLKFNDFSLDDQFMLKSCLRFFLDLDLMRRFQIDQLVLCNWILSVQKNYRKVTYHPIVGGNGLKASPIRYHNWRHAFNVGQMMFAILINTQICRALGELETLALLIACLCHDLDHRGTNNSFQIKSAAPLAQLYSTSTMEHHHFDQCVMILNSQGNQILANLSPDEYSRVIVLLKEAILATDLANYFTKREQFFQLVHKRQLDWRRDPEHRSLLRCMLMTACDVAAITKPWTVQKAVAELVMSEFHQQGDIERQELKIEPIDMMNRDKMNKLPEMQIDFIDSICTPIYTAFAILFPNELSTLLEGCLSNRAVWDDHSKRNHKQSDNVLVSRSCQKEEKQDELDSRSDLHSETTLPNNKNDSENIYLRLMEQQQQQQQHPRHKPFQATNCSLIEKNLIKSWSSFPNNENDDFTSPTSKNDIEQVGEPTQRKSA